MWECSYAKEPFDCRLMVLRLIRKIWLLLAAALAGAILLGGGYYLWEEVITGQKQYSITTQYEVIYGSDPQTGNEYTYINDVTWNSWVVTDFFLELVQEQLGENALDKEELQGYLSARLASDLRMPSTIVTTPDLELTERLNEAVQKALTVFGEDKLEIQRIRVVDTSEPVLVKNATRTVQASILGAVLSTLFVLLVMFWHYCMEEGVWVPETFTYRFGIPMVGAVGKGEKELGAQERENIQYLFRERSRIAVVAIEGEADLQKVTEMLPDMAGTECVKLMLPGDCKDGDNRTEENVKDGGNRTEENVKDGGNRTEENVKDGGNRTEENVKDGGNRTEENVKGGGNRTGENVKDGGNRTEENVKDGGNRAEESVKDRGSRISENAKNSGGQEAGSFRKVFDELRKAEGILLVVRAGAGNGRRIAHLLQNMKIQDCHVTAALLWEADRKLLKAYYFGK